MKKLIALVLALAMVATLGLGLALADGASYTITLTNTDQNVNHTYKAYQVFAGDLAPENNKLTNITWGNGVNATALYAALLDDSSPIKTALAAKSVAENERGTAKGAQALADVLSAQTGTQGAALLAGDLDKIASIIASNKATGTQLTPSGTNYTVSVAPGYYIVVDETTDLIDDDTKASDTLAKSMLSVVADVTIVAKDTGLTPDKKILKANGQGGFDKLAEDSSALGDDVDFEVTIQVPDTRKYIKDFVFTMDDQLPAGLTYKDGSLAVKINGETYAGYTTTVKTGNAAYSEPTDYVDSTGGQSIHLSFVDFKQYIDAHQSLIGKTITITYTAVVNKHANFTETGNENEVKFDYSNNPDHEYDGDEFDENEPHGTTPVVKTKTFVSQLKLLKVDGATNTPLAGAEFQIVGTTYTKVLKTSEEFVDWTEGTAYWKLSDNTYTTTDPSTVTNTSKYVDTTKKLMKVTRSQYIEEPQNLTITAVSNASGIIEIQGLNEGTYTITEIAAPAGYNKIDGSFALTIEFDKTNHKFKKTAASNDLFSYNESTDEFEITIENNSGTVLPSTGGIGTTIFYVLGGLLVVGAAVILVARRKAHD